MLRVEPADVTDDYAVLTVTRALPADSLPEGVSAALQGAVGTDLLVARPHLQAAATKFADAGLTLAGMQAYEALRIAARRPRLGLDTDHRTLPHEVGWIESAVHLNKGLLPGPGDRGPGAQPGPPAAAAGLPAPGRQRGPAAGPR